MTEQENEMAVHLGCCSCWFLINITLGAWCFHYSLFQILGKNVPWFVDVLCGFLLGQFAIIAAFICWILRLYGIEAPFVQ